MYFYIFSKIGNKDNKITPNVGIIMIFLTDTCFWRHLFDLFSFGKIDLREFMVKFKWGLTKKVLNEIITLRICLKITYPFFG